MHVVLRPVRPSVPTTPSVSSGCRRAQTDCSRIALIAASRALELLASGIVRRRITDTLGLLGDLPISRWHGRDARLRLRRRVPMKWRWHGGGSRLRGFGPALLLAVVGVVLVTGPASAGEAAAPTYAASFGPAGETIEGGFKEPEAVAVDPSGNVWVADSGHNRVIEFSSVHKYLRQFGEEGTGNGQFR